VRQRLLKECERPGFAQVAIYAKPVGEKKVRGLSIRFAEAAIRNFTNVLTEVNVIFDDETRRILRVSVIDLETNATYGADVTLEKTVERKRPREGQEVLGQRVNTQGEVTYLVRATEDDFLTKQNAAVSKMIRNHGLRLIPGDILDECKTQIERIKADRAARDPGAEKKAVMDAFGSIGVGVDRLKEYVGHGLEELSPTELVDLREIYEAIRDGETTWSAVMAEKLGVGGEGEEEPAGSRPPRKSDKEKGDAKPGAGGAQQHASGSEAGIGGGSAGAGGKITPKTFGEVYKLIPKVNAASETKDAAARLLVEHFKLDNVAALTEEQGKQYLELLRKAPGGH